MPHGELSLSQEMKEIDWGFARALRYNVMTIGEMQALKMLVTLQCLTKAGPQQPAPGYVCQCIESIVCPMVAMGIGFTAHAMMVSALSGHSSHSTSLEMDVSTADVSLLPSSIGSTGYLARKMSMEVAIDVSIMALMDASSEAPTEGIVTDWKEKDDA